MLTDTPLVSWTRIPVVLTVKCRTELSHPLLLFSLYTLVFLYNSGYAYMDSNINLVKILL